MTSSEVLAWLKARGTKKNVAGMARYGIVARNVLGVSMGTMKLLAKKLQKNHDMALELWDTDVCEARMLAALIDDPTRVTRGQMSTWVKDFDNWAICDTACFHLFDKTPHAYAFVTKWASSKEEFVKRAAFALAASLALHDKKGPDAPFVKMLPLIERAAGDERNFVKKGVSCALRGIGTRSQSLHAPAVALAKKLAALDNAAGRWVGKDALRDLSRPLVQRRFERLKSTRE